MPFSKFEEFGAVWVEKTKSSHGHGGKGWEFGTCLWSPTKDNSGKRIYKNMLAANRGDAVLHFYEDAPFGNELDHYFCGLSVVDAAVTVREEPSMPGNWAGRGEYYRVELRGFSSIQDPLPISQFVRDHEPELIEAVTSQNDPPFIVYNGHIRLAQGKYLSHCGGPLYQLLSDAVAEPIVIHSISNKTGSSKKKAAVSFDYEDYVEGQRAKREASLFARNPRLVSDAKNRHGYQCQACKFRYSDQYADVGDGFIEVHHLNPLSERSKAAERPQLTNLDEVTVLCANCHRMIHRLIRNAGRAVSIDEFKGHIKHFDPQALDPDMQDRNAPAEGATVDLGKNDTT
jgi:5-methylcytosine-specific restriction endonuclease McrA